MSQAGYGGDETVLDGPHGFWRMFGSKTCNWDFMLGGLGTEWRILHIEPKPFPSFRMSHAAIDAFRQIIRKHSLNPDDITSVEATADPVSMADCYMNRKLGNHTDAQLSWPYVLAVSAYYEPGLHWQREGVTDPRVLRLMERTTIVKSPDWAKSLYRINRKDQAADSFPVWLNSDVHVHVGDKKYSGRLEGHTKGHPDNPMTDRDLDAKFLHNASSVLDSGKASAALKTLRKLEKEPDIKKVTAMLAP
jgi:2-methylcitrate dehydratase PrpD